MSITITRSQAGSERTEALGRRIARLGAPCVGCADCRGLCHELIEVLVVPEVVLGDLRD